MANAAFQMETQEFDPNSIADAPGVHLNGERTTDIGLVRVAEHLNAGRSAIVELVAHDRWECVTPMRVLYKAKLHKMEQAQALADRMHERLIGAIDTSHTIEGGSHVFTVSLPGSDVPDLIHTVDSPALGFDVQRMMLSVRGQFERSLSQYASSA